MFVINHLQSRWVAVFAAALMAGSFAEAARAETPGFFADMAGTWRGEGSLKLNGGTSERIRCRAKYVVEENGHRLQQEMRCASDSYKMDVISDLTYKADAGVVTGSWYEKNNGFRGDVRGPASEGHMKAWVVGKNFNAELAVVTWGNNQTVTIRPKKLEVTEMEIKMKRSKDRES